MTKIAYIQPIGGASGDMLLGALVDAGLPLELLRRELAKLPVDGYALAAAEETRCEIRGTHLKVHLEDRTRYSPAVLLRTVETSPLNLVVKEQASEVLRTLWKAEARVHGEPEEALELIRHDAAHGMGVVVVDLAPEVLGMRLDSIVTVVGDRDDHGEHLAPGPAEPGRAVHQAHVELDAAAQVLAVQPHHLQHVEDAARAADLSGAITAFWTDLGSFQDDVVLLTMTEFGRTVHENGSLGTDHGRASCLFVLGNRVDGGKVHGTVPDRLVVDALEDGRDLPVTTDFRSVFAEVAGRHLNIPRSEDGVVFPEWEGGRFRLMGG